MNGVWIILFSMTLAGVIGLVTNIIAISMLFRPYKTLYIGKKKVPLTPGLIPKRQKEIAEHLGKVVMNHLLTADGLEHKLTNPEFQQEVSNWAKESIHKWLQTEERSIAALVQEYDSSIELEEWVYTKLETIVHERVNDWLEQNRHLTLAELLPEEVTKGAHEKVPVVTEWAFERLESYLNSDEGRAQFLRVVRQFLERQGSFVQMLGSFVKPDRIIERLYPEVVRAMTSSDIRQWVTTKMQSELTEQTNKPLHDWLDHEDTKGIQNTLITYTLERLPIDKLIHRPVNEWNTFINPQWIERIVTASVSKSSYVLQRKLPSMLEFLNLEEVVAEQVNAFSVERLEAIVLDISRREFRMIKYLGGVLGAVIGLVQGIVLVMLI
ncbi:DUF445 domain-containing protein [Geomicrobium sp. JCM 19055]|uniref:DUF445 domain-containing protein n=1 Tax=Geomicrobium sp. JCM 19055 TaxID=1460649 RepID=UPI00045ED629|nr:DUF445 family protein [Geomicrobium sp. JCM 19055]GAK01616.1 hypothetical protein JCM19055_4796 [Geomicrobium sp. JCM 19055]